MVKGTKLYWTSTASESIYTEYYLLPLTSQPLTMEQHFLILFVAFVQTSNTQRKAEHCWAASQLQEVQVLDLSEKEFYWTEALSTH